MNQTDSRFPGVGGHSRNLSANRDGSAEVYFGPKPPRGKEHNRGQTKPGKGWFMIPQLHGPLKPWFNQTW